MVISWTDLKDLRDLLGWTQAELAAHIGVHPKTIVNWEATDVPPRSEYKVTRKLSDELSYLEGVRGGHLVDVSLPEWKEMLKRDREHASEVYARLSDEEKAVVDTSLTGNLEIQQEAERLRQAEFEQRNAQQITLSQFSSLSLLDELARRERVRARSAQSGGLNVSGMTDDELSNLDLSQGDYDLVATHDVSTVNEQEQPNYEDESQDPED